MKLSADGKIVGAASDFVGPLALGRWYSSAKPGIGVAHWVQADIASGDALSAGTTGSRVSLAANVSWSQQTSAATLRSTTLTYNIYTAASGGDAVGGGTIFLLADRR